MSDGINNRIQRVVDVIEYLETHGLPEYKIDTILLARGYTQLEIDLAGDEIFNRSMDDISRRL